MKKTVVAAALGECVHVAGVSGFLRLAESAGWNTVFLGPAVPIETVLDCALREIAGLAGEGVSDPWADAGTLAKAVTSGILDAPQLQNNPFARGEIRTRIVSGSCVAVDPDGCPIDEKTRLLRLHSLH